MTGRWQTNFNTFKTSHTLWEVMTWKHFLLSPASVCVCVYVCVSVNHQFLRTITCHPLKLQSPKLDQKCKTPRLRSLLFLGYIDLDLQGQIELKSKKFTPFLACEFVRAVSQYQMKWGFPNLDQKCILALLGSLLILGLIDLDLQFHFYLQTCYILPNFASLMHLRRFVYI